MGVRQVLRTPGIRCRYLFVFRAVLLCQHNACYLMLTTGRTCCDEAAVYRRLYMARVISFSSSKRVPSGILDHSNLDAIWPPSITDASTGGTRVLAETGLLSVFFISSFPARPAPPLRTGGATTGSGQSPVAKKPSARDAGQSEDCG